MSLPVRTIHGMDVGRDRWGGFGLTMVDFAGVVLVLSIIVAIAIPVVQLLSGAAAPDADTGPVAEASAPLAARPGEAVSSGPTTDRDPSGAVLLAVAGFAVVGVAGWSTLSQRRHRGRVRSAYDLAVATRPPPVPVGLTVDHRWPTVTAAIDEARDWASTGPDDRERIEAAIRLLDAELATEHDLAIRGVEVDDRDLLDAAAGLGRLLAASKRLAGVRSRDMRDGNGDGRSDVVRRIEDLAMSAEADADAHTEIRPSRA